MSTQHMFSWRNKSSEPAHDKTYNKTCATSEDSDRLYPHNLIRVFADRMCLLQPPGYQKTYKREPFLYWVNVHITKTRLFKCIENFTTKK